MYVNYCCADVPKSYQAAVSSSHSELWQEAMKKELDSLEKNETREETVPPQDK